MQAPILLNHFYAFRCVSHARNQLAAMSPKMTLACIKNAPERGLK